MLCQFERIIYPRDTRSIGADSFMIVSYKPCETIKDSSGNKIAHVKAVGYCLPTAEGLCFNLHGHWSKSDKHGLQFEVERYEEIIIPNKENIIAYLSSGQIKYIGPAMAQKIYDAFGDQTLEILDKEPEKLLSIKGISTKRLEVICESYTANRAARDVIAFLTPYGITPNRAVQLFKEYRDKTITTVRTNPYKLSDLDGVGFITADKIAKNLGVHPLSTDRVDSGILHTLQQAENMGHLCMEKHAFIKECLKLLDTPGLTEDMIANRAVRLVYSGKLSCYQEMIFRTEAANAEIHLVEKIKLLLNSGFSCSYSDLDAEINAEEISLKLRLAPEQRAAVKMALSSSIAVITGGPGTGKTLIQRAILDIYRKNYPNNQICCCAPTGQASSRMRQSTGNKSSTIHKALNIRTGDLTYSTPQPLTADLVLVDEVSMLDIYLAGHLFDALKPGGQIILIGDADQLPSVGPGAFLRELVTSERIPVVRLDRVFRQSAGSRIAINARLIRHGNVGLEYGPDFNFHNSGDLEESARIIADLFERDVRKYGVQSVAVLTPLRKKTPTGKDSLNPVLRDRVNPPARGKPEVTKGEKLFRLGDKVMQNKNHGDVCNGDIGYITGITFNGSDPIIEVDFGEERVVKYDHMALEMLDLGYALTVHKSQGAEYKSVIISLQCAHTIMLTRTLIYTAITRGKEKDTIVGERKALCIAIKRADREKRGTCLARRLQESIPIERKMTYGNPQPSYNLYAEAGTAQPAGKSEPTGWRGPSGDAGGQLPDLCSGDLPFIFPDCSVYK